MLRVCSRDTVATSSAPSREEALAQQPFPPPPRPGGPPLGSASRSRLPRTAWTKILGGFAVAAAIVVVVPNAAVGGNAPPVKLMLLVGMLVAAATTTMLFLTMRRDLGLPQRTAIYAVSFNALIVLVKFVLGPFGLYEVNRDRNLTSFIPIDTAFGAALAAAVVFLLYFSVLCLIYRVLRRILQGPPPPKPGRKRNIVLSVLVGVVLLAGSLGAFALLALTALSTGGEYLSFVFSSGASVLIGLSLAGAASLAAMTFASTAELDAVIGDASVLATIFWVALAFLAMFHVLWVVYILVLTSIWPLKVVIPK